MIKQNKMVLRNKDDSIHKSAALKSVEKIIATSVEGMKHNWYKSPYKIAYKFLIKLRK